MISFDKSLNNTNDKQKKNGTQMWNAIYWNVQIKAMKTPRFISKLINHFDCS